MKEMLDERRDSPWGTTQREQKEGLEFSFEDYQHIDRYCEEKGIEWFELIMGYKESILSTTI